MSAWAPPRLVTANPRASNGFGATRHINTSETNGRPSPTDSLRRTSASNVTDQMSSKKRPLQSSGRKSPPGKRVRPGEEERYAHIGSPTTPFSPPPSRHNSIQGIDIPVPTGPTTKHRDGRHIDHSRISKDNADPIETATSPVAHGEIATPRSGNSTPQHVAPPAPSMVATMPSPVGPPLNNETSLHSAVNMLNMVTAEQNLDKIRDNEIVTGAQSGTVASLRLLKEKKNAQARQERDRCVQNLGPLADSVHAIIANYGGAEPSRKNEIDQKDFKQLLVQHKAQQIEIQQLKAEQQRLLSRLDGLQEQKTDRKDTDNLSKQMASLQGSSDQLAKLEQLSSLVQLLQADVKSLEQKQQTPPPNLTAENVQTMILDRIGPAVEEFRSAQEPKWTNMQREIDGIKNSSDIAALLDFKKRVEADNWSKQLNGFKERIDLINKSQQMTRADVAKQNDTLAKQNQKLEDMAKNLSASSKCLESCETANTATATSIKRHKHDIDAEIWKLKKQIGDPDNKPGQVAKPMLRRIQDLEQEIPKATQRLKSSETTMSSLDKKLTTLTEACEKSASDQKQLIAVLGEPTPSVRKPLLGRVQDLEQAFGQIDGQYKDFQSASVLSRNDIERNSIDIERNQTDIAQHKQCLDELRTAVSRSLSTKDTGTLAHNHHKSSKELAGDFKEISIKISEMEKWRQEHAATLDQVKEDLGSMHGNIAILDQSLVTVEQQAHILSNRVALAENGTLGSFHSKFEDLSQQIKSLNNERQEQHQGKPQQALTPEEKANIQLIPQLAFSLNALSQRLHGVDTQLQVGHRVQVVEKALQTLQERYDNISTDVLYQRMMKWFLESYGNTQDYLHCTKWLMENSKQLHQLVSITPDLVNVMQEMPQIRKTAMDASITVRDILVKVDEILHTINGHGNVIAALEKRTSASDRDLILHGTRIDEIVASVESLKNSTNLDQMQNTINALNSSLKDLDNHLVQVENKVNTLESIDAEQIKQFQGLIPPILIGIHQLQQVNRSIVANLPDGGFPVDFTLDFKSLANQLGQKPTTSRTTS